MYTPPFHRRILPWVFAAVFLSVAPVLVLYTAGYRWNPKKIKVERNGTLIVDSEPNAARIYLNDRDTEETTPVTIQNIRPGEYAIRIEKSGYHSWEKRLHIQAEFVTFASDMILWPEREPRLLTSAAADAALTQTKTPLPGAPSTLHLRIEDGQAILFDERRPGKGFVLPHGNWSIATQIRDRVILQDTERWLSVDLQSETPAFFEAIGDRLRPFTSRGETAFLMLYNGEVWSWNPKSQPELLLRQTDPIIEAEWHQSGSYIFLATQTTLDALHLDNRNGRVRTTLAAFEDIEGMTMRERDAVILGTRNDQAGAWSYQFE